MVALVKESGDGDVSVPGTIQALLAARLDQLEPAERGVLERGSVEGRVFHRGAVQALAPEEKQVDARLTGLVRKELVRPDKAQLPGEDAYRFRHLLIRDAAYEALPKATRAELHERFAAWLEEYGMGLVELEEITGYHLEQAYRYRVELGSAEGLDELRNRAAKRLAAAGRRSVAVRDVAAASNLLGRAVTLAEPTGREGVELLLDFAWTLLDRGQLQESETRYEEALALARAAGDRALELHASCDLNVLRMVRAPSFTAAAALELGHEAVTELEALGDDRGLMSAWLLVMLGENTRANWQNVVVALEHIIEHARKVGDRRHEGDALQSLGPSLFWGPTPLDAALPRLEGILEEIRGDKSLQAWMRRAIAGFYAMQGRFDEGRALLKEARQSLEELGRALDVATLAFWTGPLELLAGEAEAAERELGAACDSLETAGETGWLATMAALHAEALYQLGRFADAEAAVGRSRGAAKSDDYDAQAYWRSVYAKVLAQRGGLEEAMPLAREALEFIDRTDEVNQQATFRLNLAEVLRLAERPGEAVTVLERALELFEQKGNRVMTDRTRALLDELGARVSS